MATPCHAQVAEIPVTDLPSAQEAARKLLAPAVGGSMMVGEVRFSNDGQNGAHILGEERPTQYYRFAVAVCNLSEGVLGIFDLDSSKAGGEPHEANMGRRVPINPMRCRKIAVPIYALAVQTGMPEGADPHGPTGTLPWKGMISFVGYREN